MTTTDTRTALVTVCMICKRRIGTMHLPVGSPLPPATGQSHGICRECAPGYFRRMGLTNEQSNQILHSAD